VRRLLAGLGLCEAQGQTLIAESAARLVTDRPVLLHNPLSSDMSALRPSLLPGLLDALRHNTNRKNDSIALFELGRVFTASAEPGGKSPPRESVRVALALTGLRSPGFWKGDDREARYDLYDLKGVIEEFLEQLGIRAVNCARRDPGSPLFLESAGLTLGAKVTLGELGQLQPSLAQHYDLRDPVLIAELDLGQLLARRNPARQFKPLPQFPSVRRDVALFVEEPITHDAVLQAVRRANPPHLERVELFDVFRGKHVPAGAKSMAYAFTYRHPERTLTDAEVNSAHDALVAQLTHSLPARLRA
jgi:phenylalanyl-tRNA synthetase beta chain